VEYIERATINRQRAYKEAKNITNKICRRNKREFFKNQLLQMEVDFKTGNTEQAYMQARTLKKEVQTHDRLLEIIIGK